MEQGANANNARRLLAVNLKRRRTELGLSQFALAQLCGVKHAYISRLERHERGATIDSIYRVATALNVRIAQLFKDPRVTNNLDANGISQHADGFERRLLAWNVLRRRTELKLSQEALCIRSGLDRSYVGRIERRATSANIDKLDNLAAGLSTTIDSLFDETEFDDADQHPQHVDCC